MSSTRRNVHHRTPRRRICNKSRRCDNGWLWYYLRHIWHFTIWGISFTTQEKACLLEDCDLGDCPTCLVIAFIPVFQARFCLQLLDSFQLHTSINVWRQQRPKTFLNIFPSSHLLTVVSCVPLFCRLDMQRPHAVADVQDDEVRLRQRQMVCRCLPAVLRVVHKMREKITSVRDKVQYICWIAFVRLGCVLHKTNLCMLMLKCGCYM